jgi:glycosyltransferase involved in cell wall biosynthesis
MISELYSASNVVVSSSLYETFGQTLIEAMACGCMPVSFNNSGQTDIIDHKQTGFLAEYLSIESLAEGIRWAMLEAPKQISPEDIRKKAVTRYSESRIAKKYIEVYNKVSSDYM